MENERDWYWCSECEKAYQETDDGLCPYCGINLNNNQGMKFCLYPFSDYNNL
mgnify:CR=1 FL=1